MLPERVVSDMAAPRGWIRLGYSGPAFREEEHAMNRRTVWASSVGIAVGAVGTVVTLGVLAWVQPDLSEATDAELTRESWAMLEQSRSGPWYIGWAPAVRHDRVHQEILHRARAADHLSHELVVAVSRSTDDAAASD